MSKNYITHSVIPGGAHTNSKGDDQFPLNAPHYLEMGKGCHVWDENNTKYIDWTMGLRSVSLGYGVKEIIEPAIAQIYKGSNFGRPSYLETELAQEILDLIPKGDMVKFSKNGSSVTTAALRLARAYTGRDYVALCKDHPFFSYDDWFIGTTPCNNGVPDSISKLSLTFRYNDISSLEKLFDEHPNQISAVILEPATIEHPVNNFLKDVQELCKKMGAIFILDEMITGFRWHLNGAQTYYGVHPDLSTFGKGMGNGFSVAALVGKKEIMALGGIKHNKRRVFLLSTTHGAENHSLAATKAVLKIYKTKNVISHLWAIGQELVEKIQVVIKELDLQDYFFIGGIDCSPYYICKNQKGEISYEFRTLFLQEMIKQGVLFNYIAPSFAHSSEVVEHTTMAVRKALIVYKKAIIQGIDQFLIGPPIKPVFREFN